MKPRARSAILWGSIGTLAFLVLHGFYLLTGGLFLGFGPIAALTILVFLAASVVSYYTESKLQGGEPGDGGR